jgi:hypothetical protein
MVLGRSDNGKFEIEVLKSLIFEKTKQSSVQFKNNKVKLSL